MALAQGSLPIFVPRRRSLTRKQIRASNNRLANRNLTTFLPTSLADLPQELRDEVFLLTMQEDMLPGRRCDLISPLGPTARALSQVSRGVRAESASIYWSRTPFHFATDNFVVHKDQQHPCGRCRFRAWFSIWGRLSFQYIRRLKLTLPSHMGAVDIELEKHTIPFIAVWTGNEFGAEESLKAFVTAVLFPDGQQLMTLEGLETVCEVLCEVGRMINDTEEFFSDNGCVDRAELMERKRKEVANLLSRGM